MIIEEEFSCAATSLLDLHRAQPESPAPSLQTANAISLRSKVAGLVRAAIDPPEENAHDLSDRLERTKDRTIEWVDHSSFHERRARSAILRKPTQGLYEIKAERAPNCEDFYMRHLYERPLLTQEGEIFLFQKYNYLKYCAGTDQKKLPKTVRGNPLILIRQLDAIDEKLNQARQTRNTIIESNLRLVFSVAKKYAASGMYDLYELNGEGSSALMRAVEKFDVGRGVKFSTYASWAIQNACTAFIQKNSRLPMRQFADDDAAILLDYIPDHHESLGREAERESLRNTIAGLLHRLDPREQRIIRNRYGIDCKPTTLREIGDEFGISKERVRQLQNRALEKLRYLAKQEKVEAP
ncbi:MAG: sigma-70 family RNA polymerase sigma factor [Candidatus Peribacteraceae bacterium]|nr:sigma-70 family RNA polymerase sigma factor [Candidatus Peribacteraceae bacterium]